MSPGGSAVFVTGFSGGGSSCCAFATVAYRGPDGPELWVSRYNDGAIHLGSPPW